MCPVDANLARGGRIMSLNHSQLTEPEFPVGGANMSGVNDSRQTCGRDRSGGVFEQKGLCS